MRLLSTVCAAEARLRAHGQIIITTTAAQPNCLCDPQRQGLCSKCKGEA